MTHQKAKQILRPPSFAGRMVRGASEIVATLALVALVLVVVGAIAAIMLAPFYVSGKSFGLRGGVPYVAPYFGIFISSVLLISLNKKTRSKQRSKDGTTPIPLRVATSKTNSGCSHLLVFNWLLGVSLTVSILAAPFVAYRYFRPTQAALYLLPYAVVVLIGVVLAFFVQSMEREWKKGRLNVKSASRTKVASEYDQSVRKANRTIDTPKEDAEQRKSATPRLEPYDEPDEIPSAALRESTTKQFSQGSPPLTRESSSRSSLPDEPVFKTLRVTAEEQTDFNCRIRIRFLFFNGLGEEIALDDIHNRLYEMKIRYSAPLTLGYRSEVYLLQDNTMLKSNASYSLAPGDGFEMELVFQLTSNEPARFVFGLLLDYYMVKDRKQIVRSTIPSDCIYMLKAQSTHTFGPKARFELTGIDEAFVAALREQYAGDTDFLLYVDQIASILERHVSFRPILK
jgi:hypothetical protein